MNEAKVTPVFDAPRETTPLSTISMDVRPAGEWRATMVHETDPSNAKVEVTTVTLTDLGGTTEVAYHRAGQMPQERYAQVEEGVSAFFGRLAEHLARS